jgi:hypothetical protein
MAVPAAQVRMALDSAHTQRTSGPSECAALAAWKGENSDDPPPGEMRKSTVDIPVSS